MVALKCDVCGKNDLPTFVASSRLGPVSFAYCGICNLMRAEPQWCVEGTIEACNGIENVNKGLALTYYDQETDFYIDKREGILPIQFKDGSKLATRTEVINKIKTKEKEK